jgi:hypothetical protein
MNKDNTMPDHPSAAQKASHAPSSSQTPAAKHKGLVRQEKGKSKSTNDLLVRGTRNPSTSPRTEKSWKDIPSDNEEEDILTTEVQGPVIWPSRAPFLKKNEELVKRRREVRLTTDVLRVAREQLEGMKEGLALVEKFEKVARKEGKGKKQEDVEKEAKKSGCVGGK